MAAQHQPDDVALINMLRAHPTLYNTELADYKDGALKDHLWGEVANAVNKPVADCKRRWKYLRDSYSRCKRKNRSRTGYASLKTTKWCYFDMLKFLDRDGEENETPETEISIKTDVSDDDDDSQPIDDANFEFCTVSVEGEREKEDDIEHSRRKRKIEIDEREFNQPLAQYVQEKRPKFNKEPGDEIESFCSYIRDILRKLDPSLRVQAKTKIFNLMAQYEMKNLNYEKE